MFDLTFMTYIWLAGIVLFSVVEVATVSLFSIWFIAGSLASCVVSIFAPSAIWAQIIVFIVVSFALLAFTRPFVMKRVMKKKTATNADMAIGKNALVTEAIKKDQHGRVKLDGLSWLAASDSELNEGDWCVVTEINGATLTVVPQTVKETV